MGHPYINKTALMSFWTFAAVPLSKVDGGIKELDKSINTLKMNGLLIQD